MNDKSKLAEGGLCDWINAYLREEIDAEVFINFVIFNYFRTWDISDTLKGTILLVMDRMVSKELFSPQERKRVKELMKKAVEAYNQSDKTDKTVAIEPIIDEIFKIVSSD
jgi:hypothetical protein